MSIGIEINTGDNNVINVSQQSEPNAIVVEAPKQSVEIILPEVSHVFSVDKEKQVVTVVDKYSIVGLQDATSDKSFVYTQGTPSSVWTVFHPLKKYPSVSVTDSGGSSVFGDVSYIDDSNLIISFASPFSGKAFLN